MDDPLLLPVDNRLEPSTDSGLTLLKDIPRASREVGPNRVALDGVRTFKGKMLHCPPPVPPTPNPVPPPVPPTPTPVPPPVPPTPVPPPVPSNPTPTPTPVPPNPNPNPTPVPTPVPPTPNPTPVPTPVPTIPNILTAGSVLAIAAHVDEVELSGDSVV